MSAEQTPNTPEQSHESGELNRLADERLRELAESTPEAAAVDTEQRLEAAREKLQAPEAQPEEPKANEITPPSSFAQRVMHGLNYRDTVASLQRRLSPRSRTFSKIIHAPAVEKTAEVLEKTVMRPSVTLGATSTALILGTVFYWTARHYGFRLSGSEMIIALIVGGLLGAAIEWVSSMLRRKG